MNEITHNYVSRSKGSGKLPTATAEEITELYIQVGWLGRRRQINPILRLVPFFDRGPGIGR